MFIPSFTNVWAFTHCNHVRAGVQTAGPFCARRTAWRRIVHGTTPFHKVAPAESKLLSRVQGSVSDPRGVVPRNLWIGLLWSGRALSPGGLLVLAAAICPVLINPL